MTDAMLRSLVLMAAMAALICVGAGHPPSTSLLPTSLKIDCHPDKGPSEAACLARGCLWDTTANAEPIDPARPSNDIQRPPSCYFPQAFNCYPKWMASAGDITSQDREPVFTWQLIRRVQCPASGFEGDTKVLELMVQFFGDSMINIKIKDRDSDRFEPQLPEITLPKRNVYSKQKVSWDSANEQFKIGLSLFVLRSHSTEQQSTIELVHEPTDTLIFGMDLDKMIYSDQFIQLTTYLASPMVYGLGQHFGYKLFKSQDQVMSDNYAKSYTMFNYGHPPAPDGRTSYSSFPFYLNVFKLPTNKLAQFKADSSNLTAGQLYELDRSFAATGALMLSSNPMDVLLHPNVGQQPPPRAEPLDSQAAVTWRIVGGGIVDLYLFLGPRPSDVIRHYQSLIGRPQLPPAWALGYHQSRLNYRQVTPIKLAWAKTRAAGVPMESFWTDIDFMWRTTSYTSNSPDLGALVDELRDQFDMHYVPLLDPAISVAEDPNNYEALKLAEVLDLFAYHERPGSRFEEGRTRAIVTTWTDSKRSGVLDFTHPKVGRLIRGALEEFEKSVNYSGFWLDMNEPEVFSNEPMDSNSEACPYDSELRYEPGQRRLNDRTLCMEARFFAGRHMNLHNLFAFYQSKVHFEALKSLRPQKRPFLISRSQFVGQGKYSGTWLGDLGSSFEQLRWSLIGTIESNLLGQPLVGADICGFFGAPSDELCARWFSLGAFYPLARNHNDGYAKDQDPGSMGESVQLAARVAIMQRYSLLPYLYSSFHVNRLEGEPVIRSTLFEFFSSFEFRQDLRLRELPQIDDQFMFGPAIMVAPLMHEGAVSRGLYLPPGRWYDVSIGLPGTHEFTPVFDSLSKYRPSKNESSSEQLEARSRVENLGKPIDCNLNIGCYYVDQYTPIGSVNLYLRGGHIVPTFRWVNHEKSVGQHWENASFFLEVAADHKEEATGSLHWDSGESDPELELKSRAHFWLSNNRLVVALIEDRYEKLIKFDGFMVYGVKSFRHGSNYELVHDGVRLMYEYDEMREILVCTFKSSVDDTADSISLEKNRPLRFSW